MKERKRKISLYIVILMKLSDSENLLGQFVLQSCTLSFLKSSFLASFKMSVSCHFHKKSNLIPTKQDFYFTMNHLEEQEQKNL